MHDIEPHYKWRDNYVASEDEKSPFFGREYSEFTFTNKIYNYLIHPQWDDFGSSTLYTKVLCADYEEEFAILEMIGEWNDCLKNDIMFLKRNLIESMMDQGINKFILVCENVLNFHGSDECYYEEWFEETFENDGWVCFLNLHLHVEDEMKRTQLQSYVNFGYDLNEVTWRPYSPKGLFKLVETILDKKLIQ